MKYVLYILAIFILLILNFGVLVPLGLGWATPSLLLLIVISLSMEYSHLDFFVFALAGGLWLDLYFGLPLGSFTGAYLIAGLGSYALFQSLAERRLRYYFLFVLGAEIFLMLWLWAYTNLLHGAHWGASSVSGHQLTHSGWIIILTALVAAFPIYWLVNWIGRVAKQIWHQPLKL